MSARCSHHCRACGAHFTSLRAFDGHREEGACTFPDDAPLVELTGVCAISDYDERTAEPVRCEGVVIYQLAGAEGVRERFAGQAPDVPGSGSAQAASLQRRTEVLAGVGT